MSVKIVNECCDCAVPGYPCLGEACPRRNVEVYECDECGDEIPCDEVYEDDGEHLCEKHLLERYRKRIICTECGEDIDGEIYAVEDEYYCEWCLKEKFLKEF
jgi:hypothetical protein